jgi:hypothetical protein
MGSIATGSPGNIASVMLIRKRDPAQSLWEALMALKPKPKPKPGLDEPQINEDTSEPPDKIGPR